MDRATVIARIRERHARLETDDHFSFLDVDRTATANDVRAAYRALAREFHVDRFRNVGLEPEVMAQAEAVFARLTEAQQTLTHAERRTRYEAELDGEVEQEVSVEQMKAIFAAEEAFRRGKMHLERGQFDKALERFGEVIAVNPDDPDSLAYYHFARFVTEPVDARGRRTDEARSSLSKLERLSNDHEKLVVPSLLLGRALRIEGDIDQARKLFRRVQRLEPRNPDAQRELRLIEMRKDAPADSGAGGGFLSKLKGIFRR